jgi:4a-hydroxytetrahydrobiopterin dehydratase
VAADRVAAIAALANAQDHHPDLWWQGEVVRLTLTTHDAGGGITDRDVAFAAEINHRFPPV